MSRKKCKTEGCGNLAQTDGVCCKHGAKSPSCIVENCLSIRKKNKMCCKHNTEFAVSLIPKRCIIKDCQNKSRRDGVCCKHGADELRCTVNHCLNKRVNNGLCTKHGAKVRKCLHLKQINFCKICKPLNYLKNIVCGRVRSSLESVNSKKSLHTIEYLGLDIVSYKYHLEQMFTDGMNWGNHGEWHIDHIIPIFFKENGITPTEEDVLERLHFSNTQPMWAIENISMSNKWIG